MPRPDPTAPAKESTRRRFWRIFRLVLLFAIVIAAIAVVLVARGDPTFHVHMVIATALGVFMTVFVGAGLMALAFISNSSGHDEAAAHFVQENPTE